MGEESGHASFAELTEALEQRRRVVSRELRGRALWFVKLRWWVPPAIAACSLAGRGLGFEVPLVELLGTAAFVFGYNLCLHLLRRRVETGSVDDVRRFTRTQMLLDLAALFALVHLTGGVASPLTYLALFHVIFAAILLPPASAYGFAGLLAAGLAGLALAEHEGFLPHVRLGLGEEVPNLAELHGHTAVSVAAFAAASLLTAYSTTSIATMLRRRIGDLAEVSQTALRQGERLAAANAMTRAIGARLHLDEVLSVATAELRRVTGARATSVKLLSEDGSKLRYASALGLPEEVTGRTEVDVSKSAANRRVLEGEPFVSGRLEEGDAFQFGEDLAAAGIRSVLFVPLRVDGKVIGILGAYGRRPDRFDESDVTYFQLAADLVAIALERARAYDALERAGEERIRFMRRVAHNLRAPLAAMISILEVLRRGHLGPLNEQQAEYLRRVDRRARTTADMVHDLMTLAKGQAAAAPSLVPIDAALLAGRLSRTFEEEAARREITFSSEAAPGTPRMLGDLGLVEQVFENLVSNAVRYTKAGGSVRVLFEPGEEGRVRGVVEDTGIGIPEADRPRLFEEFFRARNAQAHEEDGTGLGLAIVQGFVRQQGGDIAVTSEEGKGSTFTVTLPAAESEEP